MTAEDGSGQLIWSLAEDGESGVWVGTETGLFRFRDAQHIVDVGFEDKIPDHRTPVDGVYLSNFSQIYPMDRGTNLAIEEGAKMAELILGDLEAATAEVS